jgi:hypothetical protein
MDAYGTKQKLLPKSLKWLGAIAVGLVLICSIVFYLVGIRASHAPTAIVVTTCGDLGRACVASGLISAPSSTFPNKPL